MSTSLWHAQAGLRKVRFRSRQIGRPPLNNVGVKEAAPDRLSLEHLEFQPGGTVTFLAADETWRWTSSAGELAAVEVTPAENPLLSVANTTQRASKRTGEETSFTLFQPHRRRAPPLLARF